MVNTRRKTLIVFGVAAYLLGFGMLVGVAIERMRYDGHRSEVLGRYEQALREWQTYRMALEMDAAGRR